MIDQLFGEYESLAAIDSPFQVALASTAHISGFFRVCSSDFTRMPKGNFTVKIKDLTAFVCESERATPESPITTTCSGLVIRISKICSNDGDVLTYRLSEADLAQN